MSNPSTTTIRLKESGSYVIGDTTVSLNPNGGYTLQGPGGFDGEGQAEQRVLSDFAIGIDTRGPDGNITRQTVVFES